LCIFERARSIPNSTWFFSAPSWLRNGKERRDYIVKRLPWVPLRHLFATLLVFLGFAHRSHAIWQLVWSDEFDGTTVDTTKWVFETGNNNGWGNSEREYYTGRTNNAFVSGGLLHIVARQESFGGFPYTSARMKTQGKFSKKYGRIEWRAKIPQGVGFWPALWMMGTNIASVGWPACGEIDVLENNQSLGNQVQGTIHYSDTNNNHLQQTRVYPLPTPGDSVTNFHTYAVEWATNSIKWLVDSNLVQTWTSWSSWTNPYPAPFNQPFFLLMNLAIGGSYLGYPTDAQINAGTVFPGEVQVDWVRVYDDVPASGPPNAPTGMNTGQGQSKVFVSWDASSSGATGYNVRRSTTSGGPYTTIASVPTNGYVDTAISTCTAYYYVVSATNSFGESANSAEAAVAVGAYALAINSGATNSTGQFNADSDFSGGIQAAPVSTTIDTTGVTAPAPQGVYQTERYSNFTYTVTGLTTGLLYKLRLHFAETYWTSVGQRRFNVSINGSQVLTNFDIVAAAGAANKANIQEFDVVPNGSGQIIVQYTTVTDNAKSSGIELLLAPPLPPTALAAAPGDSQVALSWNAVSAATSYNVKRAAASSGPFAAIATGLTTTNYTDVAVTNGLAYFYTVSTVRLGCESTNSLSTSATPFSSVIPPVTISILSSNNDLIVGWPTGILQSASSPIGPWTEIGQTSSPSNMVLPSGPLYEFFRVKVK
jgi:beta-glucanase (GH16 family)